MDEGKRAKGNNKELRKSAIRKRMLQIYFTIILQVAIVFIAAGHLNLPRVWFYFGLSIIYFAISGTIVAKLSPEVVRQRAKMHKGTKTWDKVFIAFSLPLTLIVPLIVGLDVGRFGWSYLNIYYLIIGSVIYISASMFSQWAIVANPHFETTVRIQRDRDHKVITKGPYKIVRHPGYVSIIFINISFPLIIGSVYALFPAGIIILLFIIRTYLEDKTLQKELDGYKEYAQKVKYRLFPWVW